MDLVNFTGTGNPAITRLRVTGHGERSELHGQVYVTPTSADRFIAPRVLAAPWYLPVPQRG